MVDNIETPSPYALTQILILNMDFHISFNGNLFKDQLHLLFILNIIGHNMLLTYNCLLLSVVRLSDQQSMNFWKGLKNFRDGISFSSKQPRLLVG